MVDFINEVEEELRKDQYNVLLRKWGPLIAAVALAIVAGAGIYEYTKTADSRAAKNASISYIEATRTLESGEADKALREFKAIAEQAKPGYAGLALSQAAGIELDKGRSQEAAALFDQASQTFETDLHTQLSQYKAALILAGEGRYDDVLQRVEPLTASGAPFADLARELRGYTHLAMDNSRAARSDFLFLSTSPGTSEGIRQRADQMLALTPSLSSTQATDIPAPAPASISEPDSAPTPQEDTP